VRGKKLIITMAILLVALFAVNRIWRPAPVNGGSMEDVQGLLEKANRQSKQMVAPRMENNEALKAAGETARVYNSEEFQDKLQQEKERLKALLSPESRRAQKNLETAKTGSKTFLLPDERIYLFISSSMPVSTLRNYAADIDRLKDARITVVLKGFVGGMHYIKPTIKFVEKILVKDPACDLSGGECSHFHVPVNVDPLLYSRYGIQSVPAIMYVRGLHSTDPEESEGVKDNATISDAYLVSGDVSLEYALDLIQKKSGSSDLAGMLRQLRRGFY
jgi:type-F conjugative transfer system pilin assembly protein TrbC